MTQRVLEQDLDGEWQPRQVAGTGRVEPVVGVGLVADAQRGPRGRGVDRGGRTGHGMRLLRIRALLCAAFVEIGAGRVRPSRVESCC